MTASGNSSSPLYNSDRWYLTKEKIINSPSFKTGAVSTAKETSYRQHAALLIQEMGQNLKVNQLCINTAIVYMHRFFTCHSFTIFHRNKIAKACIFLAAKVEENPRRLEHVIKTAHYILHNGTSSSSRAYTSLDTASEEYKREFEEMIRNETIILQTLGFEVTVDHPHTHVVRAVQGLKVSNGLAGESNGPSNVNDLARSSYFMATQSLHLTTFCLQYKPCLVAAVCIHIACKWTNFEIDHPNENKNWWELLGPDITLEQLNSIANEFLKILENTPTKLKQKMVKPGGQVQPIPGLPNHSRKDSQKRPRGEDHHHHHHNQSRNHHAPKAEQPHPRHAAMERSVSDKLDMLIGSSTSKTKVNGSASHSRHPPPPPQHKPEHHRLAASQEPPRAAPSVKQEHHHHHHRSSPVVKLEPHHRSSPLIKQEPSHRSSPQIQNIKQEHVQRSSPKIKQEHSSPLVRNSLHDHRAPEFTNNNRDEAKREHQHVSPERTVSKKPKIEDILSSHDFIKLEQRMKSEQLAPMLSVDPGMPVKMGSSPSPPPPPPPPPPLQRAPRTQIIPSMRYDLPLPPLHRQSEHKNFG